MFEIDDLPEVALDVLNRLHAEEVEMINELALLAEEQLGVAEEDADFPEFDAKLGGFAEHLEEHFELEESNMERTEYPGRVEHQAEHALVRERLETLSQTWLATRDAAPLLTFFESYLPEWFVDHVGTFDVPTAEHVVAAS